MHRHCGKVPYPNPVSAWRAIRTFTDHTTLFTHKQIHPRCTAYRCEQCHHWHLTHQFPPKRPEPVDPLHTAKRLNVQRLMQEVAA